MTHFDEMTALLYLEGQLDAAHAQNVATHAETCAECRELLRALETESVWLRQALTQDDESIPARVLESPSTARLPWGWIATLAFGGAGAYTLWSAIIEPWRAQAAQAGFTQSSLMTMMFFSGAFWKGWDAMRSLMESSAVVILVMVLMWLLRHRLRRATIGVVVAGAVLGALALPPSASAADVEHGNPNYTLTAGQEVKTDLIVAAQYVRIDGDVDGDLIAWAENVVVSGHVHGDILGFAQQLRVDGTVDGNVRAWVQTLTLSGTVTRNVMAGAGEVDVQDRGKIGGSLTMGVGNAQLNGVVGGDLLASVGDFELNGSVAGNATMRGGELKIGPHTDMRGATKYYGRRQAEIEPGAKLAKEIEFTPIKHGPNYAEASYYWHRMLLWGASLLFGIALLLLAPGFFFDATSACNRFGAATGFGVLFLIATPILAILVCLTIVGIGVGVATALTYVIAVYASQVFVGCWLGEKLLGVSRAVPAAIGRMALGLLIFRAAEMIPYWIGAMVSSVVLVCGLGAIVLAVYKNLRAGASEARPSPSLAPVA